MDQKMGMVVLAISCGIILLVNDILQKQGFDIYVGLNPVTLLTSGTLGFPGVALLYGIEVTKFL